MQASEVEAAGKDFARTNQLDPSQSFGFEAQGLSEIQRHNLPEALLKIKTALAKTPENAYLNYLAAEILKERVRPPAARRPYCSTRLQTVAWQIERTTPTHGTGSIHSASISARRSAKMKWNPASSPIPSDVAEMLSYAKSKSVGLLAYVYPSVPFQQNANWLVKGNSKDESALTYASMSSRELQDLLIRDLVAFKRRTRIAGYSFNYAFLNFDGSSSYAQWSGWRRVMEELRRAEPDIIIDGRQSYQQYGPWSWLAGSYPHTLSDEGFHA